MNRVALLLTLLLLGGNATSAPEPQARERAPWPIPPLALPRSSEPDPSRGAAADSGPSLPPLLEVSLSEGTPGEEAAPPGTATPLSDGRVRALLTRFPEAAGGPVGPGVPGEEPTPPGAGAASSRGGSLEVVSVLPAGETDLVPDVTVVFSRPMVPLGRDGEPVAGEPPARLDPAPPGRWRWLDVRTLRYEPDTGRLPGATPYTLTVPAGTRSVDGARLDDEVEATFATGGPRVMGGHPNALGGQDDGLADRKPVILLVFDQAVVPDDVLAAATLTADSVERPLRTVDLPELEEHDARLAGAARRAGDSLWVALRPEGLLAPGSEVLLRLDGDLSSREGPRAAGRVQELRFRVRGTLEVIGTLCSTRCVPGGYWWIDLSNPLDPDRPLAELLRVRPEVEGLRVFGRGARIVLSGDFRPYMTYDVSLLPELRDRFGQRLGRTADFQAHFGEASPYLVIPGAPFLVLDPASDHRLEVATRSVSEVEVTVWRVEPRDWVRYRTELWRRALSLPPEWIPDGGTVARWTVSTGAVGFGFSPVSLDLSPAFRGGEHHTLVSLRARGGEPLRTPLDSGTVTAWVQSTSFAVGAAWDLGELVGWAVSLDDRRPLEGVEMELAGSGRGASTDARGLARIPLGDAVDSLLVARREGEVAILPSLVARRYPEAWEGDPTFPHPVWFSLTDRGLYRPGEEVEGHGWIRTLAGEPRRDLTLPRGVDSVRWEVRSRRGRVVAGGAAPVSRAGTFHLVAALPPDMRSGFATLQLVAMAGGDSVPGWTSRTPFQVEEFRRPAYEVTGEMDPGPRVAGDVLEARATARYYDGAPLPGSPADWRVRTTPGYWSPPGWGGWTFGGSGGGRGPVMMDGTWTLEGRTDARGRHALRIRTGAPVRPFPVRLTAEVQVRDLDRQVGSASLAAVVLPARRAAGIRARRTWVRAGEALAFDVVAVDLDGTPAAGAAPVVRAFLEPDSTRPGSSETAEAAPVSCAPGGEERVGDRSVEPLRCLLRPPVPGVYRLEAEVADARGRRSVTALRRWVLSSTSPWVSPSPEGGLVLTPDRERYRPGDTARIMMAAPLHPLEGLVTVIHRGLQRVEPLRIDSAGQVLRLPIHEEDVGRIGLRVDVSGAVGGHDALSARLWLTVDLDARRLRVTVSPAHETVRPGDSVAVEVAVRDAEGVPAAGGEVALWLVDEAVLAMGGYRLSSPLEALHQPGYLPGLGLVLPQNAVRWKRRALGPGIVTAELLDAATGDPARVLQVSLDGTTRGWAREGSLLLRDVPPGRHRLALSQGNEPVLERTLDVPEGGLDLGTVLVGSVPDLSQARMRGRSGALALDALVVAATTFEGVPTIELPPPAMARMVPEPAAPPVAVRRVFRALAAFEPAVPLDEEGRGRIVVRLPDTMTRYRIMAVASQGATRFGAGESGVTARRDLAVRASPPRFLHPGDRPELPVIVQNASDRTVEAEVVARASGMELEGGRGFRVRLPAEGRTELRFPARVAGPGSAGLEVLAVAAVPGGERSDALAVPVPVRPALAPRSVAVHRRVTAGEPLRLPLETPDRAYPGFGGVEVGLSTTLLEPMVEVLRSLCLEPSYWPEATAARVMGLAALDGVLESLRAPDLPPPEELRARTEVDVERLVAWLGPSRYTLPGGGSEPGFLGRLFLVHAAHALQVAEDAGYEEARGAAARWGGMVRRVWEEELRHDREVASRRAVTGWERATAAYALHVGVRLGAVRPGPEVAQWMDGLDPADLPVEVLAWLLGPAARVPDADLRPRLLRELENRALTTRATVTFRQGGRASVRSADSPLERLMLASDRRADAAVLTVLLDEVPDHPFIPGLVRGLLGHRDGTPGGGAHENGWVMLALGRYASTHEASGADLTVATSVGGRPLGDAVHLRSGDRPVPTAVMSAPLPAPGATTSLDVTSVGRGNLYVRAGVRYAPVVTPDTPPEDRGFLVSRRYEPVDDASDVGRDEDGTWRIRAGARVRVRITFTAPARRYRVQLRDPLPAGLEAVNPRLRGTGFTDDPEPPSPVEPPPGRVSAPLAPSLFNFPWGWDLTDLLFRWRAWRGAWATHEELRDDRMEAYTPWLPAGTYQSTWLVRATTPGTFLAPPPRVEETEHPETFGQGRPDRVVVEAGPMGQEVGLGR